MGKAGKAGTLKKWPLRSERTDCRRAEGAWAGGASLERSGAGWSSGDLPPVAKLEPPTSPCCRQPPGT